jgi:hypothetical protein
MHVPLRTANIHHPNSPARQPDRTGHCSIQTTQRYIDGDTDAQRKLVAMILRRVTVRSSFISSTNPRARSRRIGFDRSVWATAWKCLLPIRTLACAVNVVHAACCVAGSASYLDDVSSRAARCGIVRAALLRGFRDFEPYTTPRRSPTCPSKQRASARPPFISICLASGCVSSKPKASLRKRWGGGFDLDATRLRYIRWLRRHTFQNNSIFSTVSLALRRRIGTRIPLMSWCLRGIPWSGIMRGAI